MKYAIIKCDRGNFTVVSEWSDLPSANKGFHNHCAALWNEKTVDVHAVVRVVDEKLNYVNEETIDIVQPKEEESEE